MTDVYIKYNPYKEETHIEVDGIPVTGESPLSYVFDHRLQEWIEPRCGWSGIFQALRDDTRDSQIQIRFHGTGFDFADLEYANTRFGSVFDQVILLHENADTCRQHDQGKKLEEVRRLYNKLQTDEDVPQELKDDDNVKASFEAAISSDFEIVVVAPMSSGKSTLINAILGRDLLPAVNEATTAIITRIRDNDTLTQFFVTAKDQSGETMRFLVNEDGSFAEDDNGNYILSSKGRPIDKVAATAKLVSQLNYAKDPSDAEGKTALVSETHLEGPIPALPSETINAVFVDTPGGNNSQNTQHQEIMEAAIHDENKSLILYVFNGTQTGTYDSDAILGQIAEEIKRSRKGKLSRDRFLFVANRMDDFDPDKEPYDKYIQNSILPGLAKHGITEPQLFLVSAQLAKLVRMQRSGQPLTKNERAELNKAGILFGDMSDGDTTYCLYQYSSISDLRKEEYDKKLAELAAAYPDADWIPDVAEINSGVPALEAAIRDYIEKYAICIKINDAHRRFMDRVEEQAMIATCEQEWAKSQKQLEKVQQEVSKKEAEWKSSQKAAEYIKRIDTITFDRKPILQYEASLRADMDTLVKSLLNNHQKQIEKGDAATILAEFKRKTEEALRAAQKKLVDLFNEGAIQKCNQMIREYSDYVKTLEKGGFLSLGGIDVKRTGDFKSLQMNDVDDMLSDAAYVKTERKQVGTRRVEKRGFFSFLARVIGVGGYETEPVYGDVTMVKIDELVKDQMSTIITGFAAQIRDASNSTESAIRWVKDQAKKKLEGIDRLVADSLKEIKQKTSDAEELNKRVEENKKGLKWMQAFIAEVNGILDI